MNPKTFFDKVIYKGITGAIVGIVSGLLLGLLIWGLQTAVVAVKTNIIHNPYQYAQDIPLEAFTMLGMSFGALIGSLGGVSAALMEEKRSQKK